MEIKTLSHCTPAELTQAFNEAFSDYIVQFVMTEEMMVGRMKGFNTDLSISPGVFDQGKLRGFIFHGVGERNGAPIVWNGGTGVAPAYRGQGLTSQLYSFILPVLRQKGFEQTTLEVIVGNDPAIHTYKKNGFSIIRNFDCYKGKVKAQEIPEGVQIKTLELIDWALLNSFRNWQPSYQNNDPKVKLLREELNITGAYKNGKLCAYIISDQNSEAGDIFQFAVGEEYRRQGIGSALFGYVQTQKKVPLKLVNVDAADKASAAFLNQLGFEKTISQYEMIKKL